jgi:hypothetical protein
MPFWRKAPQKSDRPAAVLGRASPGAGQARRTGAAGSHLGDVLQLDLVLPGLTEAAVVPQAMVLGAKDFPHPGASFIRKRVIGPRMTELAISAERAQAAVVL